MKNKIRNLLCVFIPAALCSAQALAQFLPRGITEVTDNLYWAHEDSHRTVFLVTDEGVILADPISTEFSTWLREEIQNRFGVPVRYVLYSHHHWDHVSGGEVFEDTATFVGHENMLHNLAMPPTHTPLPDEAAALDVNGNGQLERSETQGELSSEFRLFDANGDSVLSGAEVERGGLSEVRPPDRTFRDEITVTLGGEEAQLIHVGPMLHSDDMSAIVFPGERAVFIVDFITPGRLPYVDYFTGFANRGIPPGDMDSWLNAIRVVEMLDVDIVTGGHGSIGTIADVTEHRHYIEDLRDTVAAGIARGDSLEEMQRAAVFTQYDHLFNYDDWLEIQVESMYQMTQLANRVGIPGVQASGDPNREAFVLERCSDPVPPITGGGGMRIFPRGEPVEFANAPAEAIPGVIAAGQRWRPIWEGSGNNTDSPIGTDKGILMAMNDLSQIIELSLDGSVEVIATDTYTGGALAVTPDGTLYVGQRALDRGIWQVQPRRLFTNTLNGEPLECLGPGVLNDMVADQKGGMYMTMGGVYYTNADGVVSGPYGQVRGNGIALSPDDQTLYVTGRLPGATPPDDLYLPPGAPQPTGGIVAYDVQPDGSLTNERQFAWAGNDGSAVDTQGRIYTTGAIADGFPNWIVGGVWIIDPDNGEFLGYFPAPPGNHGVRFGGPDKRTLFSITLGAQTAVYAIDMLSQGFQVGEWSR